ncbi:acyl-CoA thioesterase-2 [Actinocorallia herbida]|uniref:Acyl-CoA thioesterase 2 n=1 Tax=Actinocorallia herbida TaxID=58109 RepID=A0A3N1D375_9ACTN|nr:acyl-CoA thioesterase II [Actinocorallia herbida]ROO87950.1 acyl-CoA thioesterase-2 [Actinocorallia herbida]
MTEAIDRLVAMLDLKPVDRDVYSGESPADPVQRLYGGQVVAQALRAASGTVPSDRLPHSLHGYFLSPGRPLVSVTYRVDRIRDGRSFSHRRVTACQEDRELFTTSVSFHVPEVGFAHEDPLPDVQGPEALVPLEEELRDRLGDAVPPLSRSEAFDLRYTEPLRWSPQDVEPLPGRSRLWIRARGVLPDDEVLHRCLFAYVSDLASLDAVRRPHTPLWGPTRFTVTSLDHSLWFHRSVRVDEWLLIDQHSPVAGEGRGLASSKVFTADGTVVAGIAQEGLFR